MMNGKHIIQFSQHKSRWWLCQSGGPCGVEIHIERKLAAGKEILFISPLTAHLCCTQCYFLGPNILGQLSFV